MTQTSRVVIADDNEKVRAEIHTLIESQMNMKVIAEAGNGRDAIACVKEYQPDILLLDISMSGMNGLQVLKRIRHDHPRTHVLIVSSSTDRDSVEEAQELRAHGYIAKRDLAEELILAMRRIMDGGSFLSRAVSQERIVSREKGRVVSAIETSWKAVTNGQLRDAADMQASIYDREQDNAACDETRPINVFVVDDCPCSIRDISRTLASERRITIVGLSEEECDQVCTKAETVTERIKQKPDIDILLLDLDWQCNDRGGWQIVNELRENELNVPVILCTRARELADVSEAWRNGIAGYVPKRYLDEELIPAILTVHSGETYFSSSLGERVWRPSLETLRLTPRGRQVFYLFVRDRSSKKIAEELGIDESTVGLHMAKNRERGLGHQFGWQEVAKDAHKDPAVLKALTEMERKVFKAYIKDPTAEEHIPAATGIPVREVKDLIQAIRRKLGCYPDGWKDIARKERAI